MVLIPGNLLDLRVIFDSDLPELSALFFYRDGQPDVSLRICVPDAVPMVVIPVRELGSIEMNEQVSTGDFMEKTQKRPVVGLVDRDFNFCHPGDADRVARIQSIRGSAVKPGRLQAVPDIARRIVAHRPLMTPQGQNPDAYSPPPDGNRISSR
jgi:hypothetical protein